MSPMQKDLRSGGLLEKLVPILLLVAIVMAFVVGMLWQKVSLLQKGGINTGTTGQQAAGDDAPPTDPSGKLTADQVKTVPPVTDKDHIIGDKNAKVVLIEYSDLQCPFCAQFHPTAKQVMDEYKGQVAWVFRHFPLEQIHPKALPAAIASECVYDQGGNGAFWKFIDSIYADQTTALDKLADLAVQAGVNKGKFQSCVDKGDVKDRVTEQSQKGAAAGVNGTPANFIINQKGDGWLIPGALPFASIKTTIDEALK